MFDEGKLLATGGVSNVEGAGGGGMATWALITGYGTHDGFGLDAHMTYLNFPAYTLTTWGVAAGFWDRVELSYARQHFDTEEVGAELGLGHGFAFDQDIYGAKVKVFGDAVYDQDSWMPQIAAGAQYKQNDQGLVVHVVGAQFRRRHRLLRRRHQSFSGRQLSRRRDCPRHARQPVRPSGLRRRQGLRLFAGIRRFGRLSLQPQIRARRGIPHKTDNLRIAQEDDAWDIFAAYFLCKNLSLTVAYVDLGNIVIADHQNGFYLSAQAAL